MMIDQYHEFIEPYAAKIGIINLPSYPIAD